MNEEKLEELFQLGVLIELLGKCKEIVQLNGILGGHRGYNDDMLNDIMNEVYSEIERLKEELK